MLKIVKILFLGLMFPLLASASIQKEALLVGVGEYKYGMGEKNLDGVDKDIQRMKKLLEDRGFHVTVLFNSNATLANVRAGLKSYTNLSSEDVFFFYNSSHGTQVPDDNGDEIDHKDEAYVLYDAKFTNKGIANMEGLLVDDEMDNILSTIKAKKVMFVDACHSGSMYKGINSTLQSKSAKISPDFKGKGILGAIYKPKNLVVLAASEDNQQSLASPEGSLFTSAVYDAWSSNPQITFENLKITTTNHIEDSCQKDRNNGGNAHTFTPVLYSTNTQYISQPIDSFLQVNITINRQSNLVEEYLDGLIAGEKVGTLGMQSKGYYYNGEKIYFNIDTHNKQGHLYILTIPSGKNKIEVLYPNPYYQNSNEQWGGRFTFPLQSRGFEFEARNLTRRVQSTVVYTILSERIIPELEQSRVMGSRHFQSILKDFSGQSGLKNSFKNILIQRRHNAISMTKQTFSVGQ